MVKPKRYRGVNLTVCIPSTGTWTAETAKCVALMFSYFELHGIRGVHSKKISLIASTGSMLSSLRELMVKKALQSNTTHILFIDSDMKFPMDTVHRLLEHRKAFVAANCTTRAFPVETVAHDVDGEAIRSIGKTGLQEVQHVGLAVALIEVEVLKQLTPPLFLMDWIPPLKTYCGEDVYFCQKLSELGVRMWIDHDLSKRVKHVGTYEYGHDDVEE